MHSAPLWLMKPTDFRGARWPVAKVAFRPVSGLITPRQLGPMMRMLPRRASAIIWRSSSAPSGPISLKPAEITIAPRTPLFAAFVDDSGHGRRRRHDHRQIHLLREFPKSICRPSRPARWAASD